MNGAIATLATDLAADPTDGTVSLSLTDSQTTAIAANLSASQFLTEAEVQSRRYSGAEYLWQLDLREPGGGKLRAMEGLVLVPQAGA